MWLQLEDVTRELNEKKWKLGKVQKAMRDLEALLQADKTADALKVLEDPKNKALLDPATAAEVLREILDLEEEKRRLEQLLSSRVVTA